MVFLVLKSLKYRSVLGNQKYENFLSDQYCWLNHCLQAFYDNRCNSHCSLRNYLNLKRPFLRKQELILGSEGYHKMGVVQHLKIRLSPGGHFKRNERISLCNMKLVLLGLRYRSKRNLHHPISHRSLISA